MPNWVMNRLVLVGKDAGKVANKILTKSVEDEKEFMDFNNIDRMADSLNCICGSCTKPAADYYLAVINPAMTDLHEKKYPKLSKDEFEKMLKEVNGCGEESILGANKFGVGEEDFKTLGGKDSYLKYGKTVVENRINYGASTWYEWGRKHWGVKWNASDTIVTKREPDCVELFFQTPWNGVERLIAKLGRMVAKTDVEIRYDYSEEQTAYMEFSMVIRRGSIQDYHNYISESKEAYKHYMELWGCEDDFVYDPKTDSYKYRWDEDDDDGGDEED